MNLFPLTPQVRHPGASSFGSFGPLGHCRVGDPPLSTRVVGRTSRLPPYMCRPEDTCAPRFTVTWSRSWQQKRDGPRTPFLCRRLIADFLCIESRGSYSGNKTPTFHYNHFGRCVRDTLLFLVFLQGLCTDWRPYISKYEYSESGVSHSWSSVMAILGSPRSKGNIIGSHQLSKGCS